MSIEVVSQGEIAWIELGFASQSGIPNRKLSDAEKQTMLGITRKVLTEIPQRLEQTYRREPTAREIREEQQDFCTRVDTFAHHYQLAFKEDLHPHLQGFPTRPENAVSNDITYRQHLVDKIAFKSSGILGVLGFAIGATVVGNNLEGVIDSSTARYVLSAVGAVVGTAAGIAIPQLIERPFVHRWQKKIAKEATRCEDEFYARIKSYTANA